MNKPVFPYYSFVHSKNNSVSNKDTYYDAEKFEWAKWLMENYTTIHSEMNEFILKNENNFEPYFATEMMNQPGKWQTIGFLFWGLRDANRCKKCPATFELLKKVPGLISFSISKMEPHSEIKAHFGDTDAIYRCHLPIEVPSGLPDTGFYVGYEERAWEEGKLMVFNDAAYHKGWNKTDKRRIILMLDVVRPEFMWQKYWICSMVISSLLLQKFFRFNFSNKKKIHQYLLLYPIAFFTWLYFSISRPKYLS